jgi:cytochrome P450
MLLIGIRVELRPLYELIKGLPLPVIGKPVDVFARFEGYGDVALRNSKAAAKTSVKTLFSKMIQEDGSQAFSDHILRQESANIIVAGSDTTAMTLTYLSYAVLRNPKVKEKLVGELSALSSSYSWDDLEAQPYLNRVITETLRWHPSIASSLPRSTPKEGAVLAGYKIPGGTVVSTLAHTLHHEPSVWPEPQV